MERLLLIDGSSMSFFRFERGKGIRFGGGREECGGGGWVVTCEEGRGCFRSGVVNKMSRTVKRDRCPVVQILGAGFAVFWDELFMR